MTFGVAGISFAGEKSKRCYYNDRFQTARIDNRQDRQDDRIYHGIRSGKITSREFKTLMREQERIEQAEKRAKRDGRITKNERRKLEFMQDRASKNINEAKNNRRVAREYTRYQSFNKHYRD